MNRYTGTNHAPANKIESLENRVLEAVEGLDTNAARCLWVAVNRKDRREEAHEIAGVFRYKRDAVRATVDGGVFCVYEKSNGGRYLDSERFQPVYSH